MRCVTWSRDSHGLFDYESRYIAKKNIKTLTSGRIIRLNNDVEFIDLDLKPEHVDASARPLITVTQGHNGKLVEVLTLLGKFYIHNDTIAPTLHDMGSAEKPADTSNMMFVVVRNLKSQSNNNAIEYELQKGDTIKLGRLKFSVKDFRTSVQPANLDFKKTESQVREASPVR